MAPIPWVFWKYGERIRTKKPLNLDWKRTYTPAMMVLLVGLGLAVDLLSRYIVVSLWGSCWGVRHAHRGRWAMLSLYLERLITYFSLLPRVTLNFDNIVSNILSHGLTVAAPSFSNL
jgi:hypothetical protein